MPSTRWIIDFECFHCGNVFYPVELTLLNAITPSQFYTYYIRHDSSNFCFYGLTTNWQYQRHGIKWDDGDKSLPEVIQLLKHLISTDDTIHVKGHEKWQMIKSWLAPENNYVFEIIDAPAFHTLKGSMDKTCFVHRHNVNFECAQRKAFRLIPYVV